MLSPLDDFGGPTLTMALLRAARRSTPGPRTVPDTDQRGFGRVGRWTSALREPGLDAGRQHVVDGVGTGPGQLSLRQALNLANTQTTADTITFDPVVFGSPRTINLDGTELLLSDPSTTTITGPGGAC